MKKERPGKGRQERQHTPKQQFPRGITPVKQSKSKKRFSDLAGLSIILLLGIIIYSNSFECTFHFDSFYQIVNNTKIRNLWDIKTIWNSSPNRPVAFLTFAVNYHFSQLDIRSWHAVNLAIHLVNAILVWWLTLLIFSAPIMKDQQVAKHKRMLAFFTAALFVSHPLATQSVTYIVQRMTSLVAMFYFLSLALYMTARMTDKGITRRILLYSGMLISALLAMRTKETAFTLPFSVLLIEFFFIRTSKLAVNFRDYRVILMILLFLVIILIIPFNYSFDIFKPVSPKGHPESVLTPYYYLLTQFRVILKYIQLLFVPVNQNLDYDFTVSRTFFQAGTILSFLALAGLIILAVAFFRKQRVISFGILWFFITLSVESSVIPIYDVIVEHRTYLPSFGFFLIITYIIFFFVNNKNKWVAIAVLALMTVIYSFMSYERNKIWKDDLTLWSDVVSKSPNKARAITNRGLAYANLKEWDRAIEDYTRALQIDSIAPLTLISRGFAYKTLEQYHEAIVDYSMAVKIDPENFMAYSNRGVCYFKRGEKEKAIEDFNKAIELNPELAEAYSNRSAAFIETGQLENAIADITKAISLQPDYYKAYLNRGVIFEKLNQPDKAVADYTRAIELNPRFVKAYLDRGAVYANTGRWDKAIVDYDNAIEVDPASAQAYFSRGFVYSSLGQRDKAIIDYSKAIELAPNNKLGYYNRGLTYGKMGKFELAIDDFNQALKIDPDFTSALKNREVAFQKLQMQNGEMVKW